jgi:hypothetical protein
MHRICRESVWQRALSKSGIALLVCVALALPLHNAEAQGVLSSSRIQGRVHGSDGLPLVGALVAVQSVDSVIRERFVLTNHSGVFSVPDLVAGKYLVRVTKPNFLPAVSSDIELTTGAAVALTVNLQTAMDMVRRGIRRGSLEDMKWVLRSAPSRRPILRLAGDGSTAQEAATATDVLGLAAFGYLQVYSTSMESSGGPTDSVGSRFSLSVPLALDSQVTFSGQYTEAEDQPRGFGATYEFSPADRHRSSLAVNVRQGALLNGEMGGWESREIKVEFGERLHWSEDLVLDYGTAIGRAEGLSGHNYVRPEFGVTWAPQARTAIRGRVSRQTPRDTSDEIRGREFFERAVYIPPELERYFHSEFGASHTLSEQFQVSAVYFQDQLGTQAFLVDSEDGRRAIMFFDPSDAKASGVRFYVDGVFRDFDAGIGYTFAKGLGFDPDVISPDDLRGSANERNFHVVTFRVKTRLDRTQTDLTAVYRWTSGFSVAPIDPYQTFAEYNDPTLSVTVAQDLPSFGILPAKVQAIVDARNLFEPSFGSRRTVQAGYPRLLKGGIHIKF